MKRFIVSLCRVEHKIYELEVEAKTGEEAHDIAVEAWDDGDMAFFDCGCVHAEEFIQDVKEKREAA